MSSSTIAPFPLGLLLDALQEQIRCHWILRHSRWAQAVGWLLSLQPRRSGQSTGWTNQHQPHHPTATASPSLSLLSYLKYCSIDCSRLLATEEALYSRWAKFSALILVLVPLLAQSFLSLVIWIHSIPSSKLTFSHAFLVAWGLSLM